jgi:hypothetical protein
MLLLKVMIFLITPILWKIGGTHKKAWVRDVLIPIIMGIYIGLVTTTWWIGFLSIGSYQIIKIGYGIPDATDEGSFLGRTFRIPWLVRGVAGLLYALIGGINVFIFTKLFSIWAVYCGINFVLNALGEKMKWKDYIVEPLAGVGVASLVWLL